MTTKLDNSASTFVCMLVITIGVREKIIFIVQLQVTIDYIAYNSVFCYITMGVHKCGVLPSQHHSGQPVRRLNTPSKESQQSWPCVQTHHHE